MRHEPIVALSLGLMILLSACRSQSDGASEDKARETSTPAVPIVSSPTAAQAQYVGSGKCVSCHAEAHAAWLGSHHALSMQEANAQNVLGDFRDRPFRYFSETVKFKEVDGEFFVEALDAQGKRSLFPVRYTFGAVPLQQYLVETAPGRLQSFPVAWDTRPRKDGGQRWFHLQPEEYIGPGDPLHWTGISYNWNNACADCHSTAVEKNYDRQARTYATTYEEINVGCEACHGPGAVHIAAAEEGRALANAGFPHRLASRAERRWEFSED